MPDTAPVPIPPRFSRFSQGLLAAAALLGVANLVLLQAAGSAVFDGSTLSAPLQVSMVFGGLGLLLALVPGVAILAAIRRVQGRGIKLKTVPIFSALFFLFQLFVVVGLLNWGPSPRALLAQRGSWALDSLRGQGPYGNAAIPLLRRQLQEAVAIDQIGTLAPYLDDTAAAGLACQWLLTLDASAKARPGEDRSALDQLLSRYQLDLKALVDDPASSQAALEGRGRELLGDVASLLAVVRAPGGAEVVALPSISWSSTLSEAGVSPTPDDLVRWVEGLEISAVSRTELAVDVGGSELWRARYEQGAWRIGFGPFASQVAAAQRRMEQLAPILQQLGPRNPSAAKAEPMAVVDDHPGPRGALRRAAEGRFGWMAGTTAFDADWPAALTHSAAVAQAERVRGWCVGRAGDDLVFRADHERLAASYGLGAVGDPLSNAQRSVLEVRGRRYFGDVLTLCAPVTRSLQARDVRAGRKVADARRMRWAERDAAELAGRAKIKDLTPGRAEIDVDRVLEAVMEDGAWRVQWAD